MSEKRYPRTILATACVPWTESYELEERIFRNEIRGLIGRGIRDIYLFGTAGEGHAVTEEQFETIISVFADEMKGPDLFPMVGLISLSLPVMLQRVRKAYSYGIRDFQFALPCWGVLSDDELEVFVHALCDPFPDCRFLHYNLMRAKRLLGIRDYEKLASEVPNFVGVKYGNPDLATVLDIAQSDCPLQFFVGEAGFGYGSLIGEFGYLLSIATPNIRRAWDFFNAALLGDKDQLLKIQKECALLRNALMKTIGTTLIDGGYDKIFCKLLDEEFPLRLLPPYKSASEEGYRKYKETIETDHPAWSEKNNP